MAYTDPYRLTSTPAEAPRVVKRGDVVRTLLWSVVVLGAAANIVSSYAGVGTWVHLVSGVVTVVAASTLVVRRLRGRR